MNALTEWIQYELYPALFDRVDEAFPTMEFRSVKGEWHSSHKLNGEDTTPRREDKTVITKRVPTRALEQGGRSVSLVDLYLMTQGESTSLGGAELVEALRPLAAICGLSVPECDTEEYKAFKAKVEQREKVLAKTVRALFSPEGAEVLKYLKEERGYSEKEILDMELGYCSAAIRQEMEGLPGPDYVLTIPYRSGGRLYGFKLRRITEVKGEPKYKFTKGCQKKEHFFGLTGLKLTGNREKDRDITIVEGELDALRAQVRGVENIVAAAGLDIHAEALMEAKKRGVKRVTILVDWEETEKSQRGKDSKIERAIRTIAACGLKPFVAELSGEDGKKVDTDTFLSNHSAKELKEVIDNAQTAALYLYGHIYNKAVKNAGDSSLTDKDYDDYEEEVLELVNNTAITSATDCDRILDLCSQSTGGRVTKESLQAKADTRKRGEAARKRDRLAKDIIKQASDLQANGETDEALRLLGERVPELRRASRDIDLRRLLITPTADALRERLKARPEGIETNYEFGDGGKKERLILPAGAITLVAGGTSHCKSTLLRNLALQTAGNGMAGTVPYFSLEESMEDTILRFVNLYANLPLTETTRSFGNLTTIGEYYRKGETRYIKHELVGEFKEKEAKFMSEYLESGRLRIYDSDFTSNELVEAIKYIASNTQVKAVFVDYVQLLYAEGNKLSRNEELKEIAKNLRETAKALRIPIVMAAQLNREAKSPTEMHSQNIADSADLEREASKIIVLWNSKFRELNGSKYDASQLESDKAPNLGTEGQLYAKLAKNRGGSPYLDALLVFRGDTGMVEPNYRGEKEEKVSVEGSHLFGY